VGYHQLQRVSEMNAHRTELAAAYESQLSGYAGAIQTPVTREGATHTYQMYTILVPSSVRDQVLTAMIKDGINASCHFDPPVHLQPYYAEKGGQLGQFPVTEELSQSLITLPMFPGMTDEEQRRVIKSLHMAMDEAVVDI
jgi:dTDP-4-amino-4,6-dideoxygalactose transaminase